MQPKPLLFGVRLAIRWNRHDIRQNASWIKKELINMGPAYVKMGQLVATRSDLFPEPPWLNSPHYMTMFLRVRLMISEDSSNAN